ncbi:MAG: cysteine peptidase family C39 domain-containing protein, partial [Polaribacter sp.]
MDCGPACVAMIAQHYGKIYSIEYLRKNVFITKEGVSLLGIEESSKSIGLDTNTVQLSTKDIIENKKILPCVLHWNQNHFVVLYRITKPLFSDKLRFHIADPAHGIIKLSEENFKKSWLSEIGKGVVMFLSPTEEFEKQVPPQEEKLSIKYLFTYLKTYKKQLAIMFLLLLMGSGLTLAFPF